jgi:hypothetical protein
MTTSSQTLTRTLPGLLPSSSLDRPSSLAARVGGALSALRCRLQGHAPALCIEDRRVYLACPDCRVESAGWQLDLTAPRPRFAGAPDRFDRYSWITGRR